jgi:Cupredoxin-like domain
MLRINVAALLLVLICGVPAVAEQPTVTVTLRDHQFVPAEVPVPAGVKIELVMHNAQAVAAEFESTALHREKIIPAGGQVSVFVGPLDPGRYEFFDDFNPATRGVLVAR